jgi:hypothetical protein
MHYLAFVVTAEKPTEEILAKTLDPFRATIGTGTRSAAATPATSSLVQRLTPQSPAVSPVRMSRRYWRSVTSLTAVLGPN